MIYRGSESLKAKYSNRAFTNHTMLHVNLGTYAYIVKSVIVLKWQKFMITCTYFLVQRHIHVPKWFSNLRLNYTVQSRCSDRF